MHPELDPKALYAYLHELVDSVTRHNDECDDDLLECDCGADTPGGDLVEACFAELARLRAGHP
jgi:hypothetical protein